MPQQSIQSFFGAKPKPNESPSELNNVTTKIKTSKKHKLHANSSPPFKRVHTLPHPAQAAASLPARPAEEDARKLFDTADQPAQTSAIRGPPLKARGHTWFSRLFGFEEKNYAQTKAQFEIRKSTDGGTRLVSKANNHEYEVGRFETPSLSELRTRAIAALRSDEGVLKRPMKVRNALGDVSDLIGDNPRAVVQAASQFNCLEFVAPSVTPERGVAGYSHDRTQGPACSIACGPGTVYRNYLVPVETKDEEGNVTGTQSGQTSDCQLDNLSEVCRQLGNTPRGRYYKVQGGYTMATDKGLTRLNNRLAELDREAVKDRLRVGVHADIQVTATNWGKNLIREEDHTVTQIFCSACSVSYSGNSRRLWESFACLVLEASYEATLWAAVLHALKHKDDPAARVVLLTAVGGGVFGLLTRFGWRANVWKHTISAWMCGL